MGDLELLDDTVGEDVTRVLLESVRLIAELTDVDEETLFDICGESELDTVDESALEIDGDPDTLYDS